MEIVEQMEGLSLLCLPYVESFDRVAVDKRFDGRDMPILPRRNMNLRRITCSDTCQRLMVTHLKPGHGGYDTIRLGINSKHSGKSYEYNFKTGKTRVLRTDYMPWVMDDYWHNADRMEKDPRLGLLFPARVHHHMITLRHGPYLHVYDAVTGVHYYTDGI